MPSTSITLGDDAVLGEYADIEKFRGFAGQRLGIGPDLLALLIRDGRIVEAAHGAHIAIGGFWRGIKDALFGQHALRLLLVDLKPFPLTANFEALTRDGSKVAGELVIEMQVDPAKPANILGLMKERRAVAKQEVLARLLPHLGDRVLQEAVRRVAALDLRGNTALQNKVQAEVMTEVERLAGDLGLVARAASLSWAFNEDEIAAMEARGKTRAREAAELDAQILNRAVAREGESTVLKLQTDLDIEKLRQSSDAELRRMVLDDEIKFLDARSTGVRIAEMTTLRHELDLANVQRLDGLAVEIGAVQHAAELSRQRGAQLAAERANVDAGRLAGQAGEVGDVDHQIALAKRRGELETAQQANQTSGLAFQIAQSKLNRELGVVNRDIEETDHRHKLLLQKLTRQQQLEDITDLADRNAGAAERTFAAERARLEAMQTLEQQRLDNESRRELARIAALSGMPVDHVMAITAQVSPAVANILVEQVRANAAAGADRERMLREMVQMATDRGLATEAQAREFFALGMQGTAGVAQGVGGVVAGAMGMPAQAPPAKIACKNCGAQVPAHLAKCPRCQHDMRA